MNTPLPLSADDLFAQALNIPTDQRGAFLEAQCARDPELLMRLHRLLECHHRAGSFLEQPALEREVQPDPPDTLVGRTLGEFRILRVIASGGMGTVYEAEQENPRRVVALKVVRATLLSPSALRRFQLEIDVLGRLRHPGIAQIYEAGTTRGGADEGVRPFFAMELVRGRPLTDYAREHSLDVRQRLDLMARVCDAVHHAHQKGVIHRDLKPGNILVEEGTGREGTGDWAPGTSEGMKSPTPVPSAQSPVPTPKILDFGVARATAADLVTTAHTSAGQLVGTLPYMSPEQVGGDPDAADVRSDVYALGVILYELLGGRQPLDLESRSLPEAARIIREDEPTPLHALDRSLGGDLETIVGKAMEKDPPRRYESAAALGEDIRRYLRDEPIAARPATALYQLRKFARRNRALVAGAGVAVAALVLGVIGTSIGLSRAVAARDEAVRARRAETEQRAEAQARADEARFKSYAADIAAADAALRVDDVALARARLDAAAPELRNWEWRHLWSRLDDSERLIDDLGGRALACSADGRWIAGGGADSMRVAEADTGRLAGPCFGDPDLAPHAMAFSPDGARIATADDFAQTASVWDWRTGQLLFQLRGHTHNVHAVEYSPDGARIATAAEDGTVRIWDAGSGAPLATVVASDTLWSVRFSPDGRRLISAGAGTCWIWETATLREVGRVTCAAAGITFLAFSPDGRRIAGTCTDGLTRIWDAGTGRELRALQGHRDALQGIDWSPGGMLATASKDRTIKLWDPDTGLEQGTLRGHAAWITGVAFDRAGSGRLFSCSIDGLRCWHTPSEPGSTSPPGTGRGPDLVRRWRGPAMERDVVCRGHLGDCGPLVFSPDGTALLSAGRDTTLRVWDPATGEPIAVLDDRAWTTLPPVFDRSGRKLWMEASGSTLAGWDARAWRRSLSLPSQGAGSLALGLAADGSLLTHESGHRAVVIRNPDSGAVLDRWEFAGGPGAGEPGRVRVSGDGRVLARSWRDGVIEIWDVAGRRLIREIAARAAGDRPLWLDAAGRLMVMIDDQGMIDARDTATGQRLALLRPAIGFMLAFGMSPDGSRLATGTSAGAVLLWDTSRWSPVAMLRTGVNWVEGVAFTPDGQRLAACTSAGEIYIWDTDPPGTRLQRWRATAASRAAAAAWVGRLVQELGTPEAAAEAIGADTGADPDVREAALRQARSQGGTPEAMFAWAWGVLSAPGGDRQRYDWAYWMIRGLIHAWSRDGRHRVAEAAGQYRLGDPGIALRTLDGAIPQIDPGDAAFQAAGSALRALCLQAQGRPADAREAVDRARTLAAALDPAAPESATILKLLREAESAVGAPAGG